jgi:hypothetical protein
VRRLVVCAPALLPLYCISYAAVRAVCACAAFAQLLCSVRSPNNLGPSVTLAFAARRISIWKRVPGKTPSLFSAQRMSVSSVSRYRCVITALISFEFSVFVDTC